MDTRFFLNKKVVYKKVMLNILFKKVQYWILETFNTGPKKTFL